MKRKPSAVMMIVVAVMVLIVSCGEDPFFHHITIMDGDTVVKTETIFGEDGYVLPVEVDGIKGIAGWLYDGKEYEAGERIYPDGDITITAIKGTIISISLYDDVTTHVILKKGETEFTLPVKPTRDGYDFDGWKVDGTVMNPGDKVTYTEGMTISAVWTKLYYVTYYNGTTLVETKSFREGAGLELNDGKALSNGDLIFTGWSRTNGSKTAEFAGGSTYSENKDITLYAVWSSDISIIYMSDGKQVQKISGSPAEMKTWNPDDSELSKTGYKLDGWYTGENGAGTYYAAGADIKVGTTLYAHWVDENLIFSRPVSTEGFYVTYDSKKRATVESVVIPSVFCGISVSAIESSAFSGSSLLTSVTLPSSITAIDSKAFKGCVKLTAIELPDSLITIGESAFEGSGLTDIYVPESVEKILLNVFSSCTALKYIYMEIEQDKAPASLTQYSWGAPTATAIRWGVKYRIGDTGPAGGIVFYDVGSTQTVTYTVNGESHTYTWRYLEAAPENLSACYWGSTDGISGTSKEIGTGKGNTAVIMSKTSETSKHDAAKACDDYVYPKTGDKQFDDWFLPSEEELEALCNNIYKNSKISNEVREQLNSTFWTSSQYSSLGVWFGTFSTAYFSYMVGTVASYSVRPIRSFV